MATNSQPKSNQATHVDLSQETCVCKSCAMAVWFIEEGSSKPTAYCKELFMPVTKLNIKACQAWQAKEK